MKHVEASRSGCPSTARGNPQKPRKPSLWDFAPEERIALGRRLLAMKDQLPHGHFWPWVRENSGLRASTARACIEAAKDADFVETSAS